MSNNGNGNDPNAQGRFIFGKKKPNGLGQGYTVPTESRIVDTTHIPVQIKKFPPKGWDFPRRYIDITPEEILYDPGRILGTRVSAQLRTTGDTILRQPRVESTGLLQRESINDCPPPSQLPYIKRQIHLDPSRDAETFYCTSVGCVEVPALSSVVALAFDTFPNLRHEIRWIDVQVFDALCPVAMREVIRMDCDPRKYIACPASTATALSGGVICDFAAGTVATPLELDMTNMPKDFHNLIMEVTDRHHMDVVVINEAPADRRVQVTLWGWIESITAWDEVVKR